jgi:hypothetical protein
MASSFVVVVVVVVTVGAGFVITADIPTVSVVTLLLWFLVEFIGFIIGFVGIAYANGDKFPGDTHGF